MASHIHGLVQQLGVDRHSVVAHDIGAWAAFPYGLLYGDEIDSMAFLDAGIPGVTMPTSVSLDPATVWKTMHFAFHQVDGLPEILLSGHERDYVAWFLRTKSHAADAFTDDDIDRYGAALAEPGAVRAALAYYRAAALSGDQNRELLETRRFTMPVLGVSAEFGSIPDMAAALRPFADRVENVDHAVIAGSGHFIPDEQPAALSAALRAHLG